MEGDWSSEIATKPGCKKRSSKQAADLRVSTKIRRRPVVENRAWVGDNYEPGTHEAREIMVSLADVLNRFR